ncbi:hypothetical protein GCM10026982_11500 [Nocardiopsis aegyptia]
MEGAVVIVGAGLDDVLAQVAIGAVQHVPVAQDVGSRVVPVVDDTADRARRDAHVPDAHARHDGIDPVLAHGASRLGHDPELRLVAAFDHVGGHLDTVHHDRLGQQPRSQGLQRFGPGLGVDGELEGDLPFPPAVLLLVADADRRDVGVPQVVGPAGADERTQGGDEVALLGFPRPVRVLGGHGDLPSRNRCRRMGAHGKRNGRARSTI